ncbi:hypothetical protein CYMTET_38766 [Cymbomonas tetramitiformis]|uniref:Uncharacterized protein n=1 Tax=Cymbomonas tetramitiformis TaxID=36881 RepID=A0AAE0F4Y0_9CHLO|nr:hypothetical protein CYMTET_38766 [Cymbomonas tetramitiformis]
MTASVVEELGKIRDGEEQMKYVESCKAFQLEATPRGEDSLRAKPKSAKQALPEGVRKQVREIHMPFHEAEGPQYARHLAARLYAGEEYCLQIDSHMRFKRGWDHSMLQMLHACPSLHPILTTYPLAYKLDTTTVADSEGRLVGTIGRPGSALLPDADDDRPSVICATKFGPTGLCHMAAHQLHEPHREPLPGLFWAGMCSFSRAEALMGTAPPDPHAPYLHLGDEASTGCRLWTHGWDFFVPCKNVIYHLYRNDYRQAEGREDRRMGLQLYAGEEEASGGIDQAPPRPPSPPITIFAS